MKPQDKSPRGPERDAVYTTIVGGRPPGSGTAVGDIPHGIEVLVKKASIDPQFRALLLDKRADAAKHIGLELAAAEAAMLTAIPQSQFEAVIASAKVNPETRRVFLGQVASLMLAALGVQASGCKPTTKGIQPDRPQITDGIRPDRPENISPEPAKPTSPHTYSPGDTNSPIRGIRSDLPPVTKGIQPDRPPQ